MRLFRPFDSQRLVDPVRVEQPLILVSQIQRSGGTLLSQLLDGHPNILAHPYELKWGRPEKWDWPEPNPAERPAALFRQLTQRWVHDYASRGFYTKGPSEDAKRYPFSFDVGLQKAIFIELAKREKPQTARSVLNHYMTSFFNAWHDYQGFDSGSKKYISAFTPRVLMVAESVERLERTYPDGFVISSVRHPAGWYASAIKQQYGKLSDRVDDVMDFWIRSTQATMAAKRRLGDRLLLCSFEELVTNPVGVTRFICARLSLPWDGILARPTFNEMAAESNSHYAATSRVDAAAASRFTHIIPQDVLAHIDRLCGETHARALEMIEQETDATACAVAS